MKKSLSNYVSALGLLFISGILLWGWHRSNANEFEILNIGLYSHSRAKIESIDISGVNWWHYRYLGELHTVYVSNSRVGELWREAFSQGIPLSSSCDWGFAALTLVPLAISTCALAIGIKRRIRSRTVKLQGCGRYEHFPAEIVPAASSCIRTKTLILLPLMIVIVFLVWRGTGVNLHTNAEHRILIAPGMTAIAYERWPLTGACPEVKVLHFVGYRPCVHDTSTCASHVCMPDCQLIDIYPYACDFDAFPFHEVSRCLL